MYIGYEKYTRKYRFRRTLFFFSFFSLKLICVGYKTNSVNRLTDSTYGGLTRLPVAKLRSI